MVSAVVLRVTQDSDLPELTGGDSEFDDWGPREPRRTIARSDTAGPVASRSQMRHLVRSWAV